MLLVFYTGFRMDGFEWNKLATAFLLSVLVILVFSNVVDAVYDPEGVQYKRGYTVDTVVAKSSTDVVGASQDVDVKDLLVNASVDRGKKLFGTCASCHTVEKGGANRVGPNLWGIVGAKRAHLGDKYNYSKAMLKESGIWDYDAIFAFLLKPSVAIKGTKMSFAGISKPQDRADLIAYLRTMSDNPLPSDSK